MQVRMAVISLPPRSTGNMPSLVMIAPSSLFLNSSFFEMKRISRFTAPAMKNGSSMETWLLHSMTAPSAGTFSSPVTRCGKIRCSIGQSNATAK